MVSLLIAGAIGGIVRGLVGFIKHQYSYKNVEFKWEYFGFMMVISAIVGTATSWALASSGLKFTPLQDINPAIAFIAGYAGGDFIENMYKILLGKTSLYPGK